MAGVIYLFCSEEDFLKEEASKKVISTLLPESDKFNFDVYNAKDDYRGIFDAINTLPFLSSKRIVLIRDIESLPEPQRKPFLTYLKNPPEQICLILQSSQNPSSDKFIKSISQHAKTSLFKKPDKRNIRDWINNRLSQEKKSITRGALEVFLELKGNQSLDVLSGELEKLVIYKGQDKTIKEEDVISLVGKSITKGVFDLIEAVSFKNRDTALSLVRELSSGNKKRNTTEVIGLMGWQLRRIWKAKRLIVREKSRNYIASELKIRSFSVDRFFNQIDRFNNEELKRGFGLLVEADRSIKTGRKRADQTLEELVIRLCGA